jgi:hypothetical protein
MNENRKIKAIYFPNGNRMLSKPEMQLMMTNDFHGEHDEDWIVALSNGVEISRYNPRFVESIDWDEVK